MNPSALEMAREGVYPEERAADFERNYLESGGKGRLDDYFSRAYGRIVVREGLRRNVVFFQHDLASDQALGEMHVVFCRNVMIYFGTELRERALTTFASCLERSGFLCLGMNEGLSPSARAKFANVAEHQRIFRRRAE
jgi:chemotaxis protein methyltransferase CheR